jgi:hypothetical protein
VRRFGIDRLIVAALVLTLVTSAWASAPRKITFDQTVDCASIATWDLAYEPVATAGTVPSAAAKHVSIPNVAPLVCGAGVVQVVPILGAGNTRFWLTAVASDGTPSAPSNSKDAIVPPAAPVLVSVGS